VCQSLLFILLGIGVVFSQSTEQTSGAAGEVHPAIALLAGIVTKDPGGEPVKKAIIELIAESQSDGGNYTTLTGIDGSFRIENISPGRYHLFVEHTGYQEVNPRHRRIEGRVITLAPGQEFKNLTLHLQAAAVVEGRVTDEDGDPMPSAQVSVLRRTFVSGHSHWEQAGAERTNDLGEYRISNLAAGNYFVSVTPPPDFRSFIETTGNAPAPARPDKPQSSYQTTYYPGTRDRTQAAPIQLHPGDDFPANFSLAPSPSLAVRGSVVSLPAGSTAGIVLQSKEFNLVLNGAEVRKDGSFEIRDVSPGAYTILATVDNGAVPLMARQALQVTSANIEGLRLAPQPGGSIYGRLRMEDNKALTGPDPSQIFLQLRSADGDDDALIAVTLSDASPLAHVNTDGSFVWKSVPPGRYFVQISDASTMPDWFVKSVAAGGHDADSGFTVAGGTITLDLLASATGAVIDGVVSGREDGSERGGPEKNDVDNSEPVADLTVVAVPEARFRSHPDRYRKAVTDQRGHFTLRGLPPGDYTLFAWESVDGEAYYDADFLKSYEGRGKALHVNEGERVSMQLRITPVAED